MGEDEDSWELEIDPKLQDIFRELLKDDYDNSRTLKRFLFRYTIYRKAPSEGNPGDNLRATYGRLNDMRVQKYCQGLYDRRKDEQDLVDIIGEVFSDIL